MDRNVPTGEQLRVLRPFLEDGRITSIPTKLLKRRALLEWLVNDFEPGRRYSEKMVNLIIGIRHADTAALRRYLIEERLMERADGVYWRTESPAPVDGS